MKKLVTIFIMILSITLFQSSICLADNWDDFEINTQIEIKDTPTKYKGLGAPKDTNSIIKDCINVTNGNFLYSHQDFAIPYGGKLIEFTRTYNSRDDYIGPLGYGWTHSFNVRLIISSDKIYINFVDEDGTRYRFKFSSPEYPDYILPETKGVYFKLRYSDGYNLREKDGTIYFFDKEGKLLYIQDRLGNKIELQYDTTGKLIKIFGNDSRSLTISWLGDKIQTVENKLGHKFTYSYEGDKLTKVVDPLGNITTYNYDSNYNLTSIIFQNVIDADNKTTDYDFDVLGNLVSVLDANQHKTSYEYNPYWLTKIIDPLGYTTQYSYDNCGNPISKIDAEAKTTQYTYDSLNRLTQITYPDPQTVNYEYDGIGLLTSMTDSTGKTSYTYDQMDRLIKKTLPPGLKTGNGYISYTYDSVGNRKTLTDPFNRTIQYTSNTNNQLTNVQIPSGNISYEYNKINLPTKRTYPNQINAYYTYDSRKRLTLIENKKVNDVISSFSYGYDSMSNRVRQQERNFGVNQGTTTYQYDNLYRLIKVTYPDQWVQFTYDAVGNRKTMSPTNDLVTSYEYDAADRLVYTIKGTERINYYYDKNGNMTSKTTGEYNWYEYDGANRLKWVKYGINILMTAEYDGFDRRIEYQDRKLNEYTNYVYDGVNVLLELDTGTNHYPKAEYIYANGRIICKYVLNSKGEILETYFYHYDGLGSVVNVTSPKAERIADYSYDAFGEIKKQVGPWDINKFTFTGKHKNLQTGLYYFGARYYDDQIARFITKDSYLGDELNPKLRHRYTYCANNPVSYVDPYGYWMVEAIRGYVEKRLDWQVEQGNTVAAYIDAIGLALLPESDKGAAGEIALGLALGPVVGKAGGKVLGKAGERVAKAIEGHHTIPKQILKELPSETREALIGKEHIWEMPKDLHRLKPEGIHTKLGGDYNTQWMKWLKKNPNPEPEEVLKFRDEITKEFGIDVFKP